MTADAETRPRRVGPAPSTDVEAIAKLAQDAADPLPVGDPETLMVAVVPEGAKVVHIDLIDFADAPRRKTGTAFFDETESFEAYVTRHSNEHTTVWIDEEANEITALLNDHGPDEPGWGDHRAVLKGHDRAITLDSEIEIYRGTPRE